MKGAVLLAALLAGCPSPEARERASPAPVQANRDLTARDYPAPALPRARVVLRDAYGGAHQVDVEVAATGPARTRGLMWREVLPAGQGMLFVFPFEQVQSFWMRNTLIPLDMIFIDGAGRVLGIIQRAEPQTLTSRSVGKPGRYVLEVPGGWSESIGLKAGSVAQFEGLSGIPSEP